MHRDIKKELQNKVGGDLKQHQKMFDKWKKEFNEIRPHEALGMKTPKECYEKSLRKYWGARGGNRLPWEDEKQYGKRPWFFQLENEKDIRRQSIFGLLRRR